jgi:hypothetical protein
MGKVVQIVRVRIIIRLASSRDQRELVTGVVDGEIVLVSQKLDVLFQSPKPKLWNLVGSGAGGAFRKRSHRSPSPARPSW